MDNCYISVNKSRPIKRIGLSRKRKRDNICSGHVKDVVGDHCEKNIVDENTEVTKKVEKSEAHFGPFEKHDEIISVKANKENILKCSQVMVDKIMEIESLYFTWRNGCKSAFLYLLDKITKLQGQNVDVWQLLTELKLLNTILTHFSVSYAVCSLWGIK